MEENHFDSGQQWLLMEMCEDLRSMKEQEDPLEGADENAMVITILTKEGMTTVQMGFEVDADMQPQAEVIEAREHEIPIDEPNH